MKNKRGFEFSFAWLFAILAGGAILFLAIYGTTRFISTSRTELDTKTSTMLSVLLEPLKTSQEDVQSPPPIVFKQDARIYNNCFTTGNFGRQEIGVVTKSGIGSTWQDPSYGPSVYNKYIFSRKIEEGREFDILIKPFKIPFKVDDLIFFSSQDYCFIKAPEVIKEDLQGLGINNIALVEKEENCSKGSETVCFTDSGCDILVLGNADFSSGSVIKDKTSMYYTGPLLYGAIFADPEIYECNVKRLMLRTIALALIYQEKISFISKKDCNSALGADLTILISNARNLKSSKDLINVENKAKDIKEVNDMASCKIF